MSDEHPTSRWDLLGTQAQARATEEKGESRWDLLTVDRADRVRILREKAAQNPDDGRAHQELGFFLSDGQAPECDLGEARDHLDRAVSLGLDDVETRVRLSSVMLELNALPQAEENCRRALEHDPKSVEATRALGAIQLRQGRFEEARETLSRALDLLSERGPAANDALAETHIGLAELALAAHDLKRCETECGDALKAKPGLPQGYLWLGRLAAVRRDFPAAIENLQKAARLAPTDALMRVQLGVIQEMQGQPEAAEREYRRACELKPNLAAAHARLGIALKAQNRLMAAEEELVRARKLDPENREARNALDEFVPAAQEGIESARQKTESVIKRAEDWIAKMEDRGLRAEPEYAEASKHLERARELADRGLYHGYVEAEAEAHRAIDAGTSCVRKEDGEDEAGPQKVHRKGSQTWLRGVLLLIVTTCALLGYAVPGLLHLGAGLVRIIFGILAAGVVAAVMTMPLESVHNRWFPARPVGRGWFFASVPMIGAGVVVGGVLGTFLTGFKLKGAPVLLGAVIGAIVAFSRRIRTN